ncbi:MAG: hypothetical protein AAF447_20870, partial [Myxococcota bacterium]
MTYALYFGATDSEARERATPDFVIADFDGAFVGTQIYAEAGPIPPLAFELDPPRRLARLDDYWRALEDHAFASAPAPGPPEPARFLNDAGAIPSVSLLLTKSGADYLRSKTSEETIID